MCVCVYVCACVAGVNAGMCACVYVCACVCERVRNRVEGSRPHLLPDNTNSSEERCTTSFTEEYPHWSSNQ